MASEPSRARDVGNRMSYVSTRVIVIGMRDSGVALHLQSDEPAVDGHVAAGDERCSVGAEEERELGNLVRLSHASDRLCAGELVEHLALASRIVLREVAIDER